MPTPGEPGAPEDTPDPDDLSGGPEGPARHGRRSVFYPIEDRPFIDVQHTDGNWYPGRLHAWIPDGPGWRAVVSYLVGPGRQHLLDVPAERVRRATDL